MTKTLSQPFFSIDTEITKSCSICIANLNKTDLVSLLFCKHLFHTVCIEEWLNSNNTCPLCRKKCYY